MFSTSVLRFLSELRLALLCSCLCLFDTIVELHAMDEKRSMTFSLTIQSEI